MKSNSEITTERTVLVSRKTFWSYVLLIILSGSISVLVTFNELTWKWLEILGSVLSATGFFLLIISWITPGVLVLFGVPWLAHAWLRGMNPIAFPPTPWNELSRGKRVSVYFTSVFFFIFAVAGLLFLVERNLN